MNSIAALTSGLNTPSARFRVRQYIPRLKDLNLNVIEYCPVLNQAARLPGYLGTIRLRYLPPLAVLQALTNAACRIPGVIGSRRARLTWLERNFIPSLDDLAVALKQPLVVDIDDSIWLYHPFGRSNVKRLIARADLVLAGNSFLANWCSDYCPNVALVPTAIDTTRFSPRQASKSADNPFTVGWTGTSGNFQFLRLIEPALAQFLARHPSAEFVVVADREPLLPSLPARQYRYERWTPAEEHSVLHRFDVGIMPIDDTELSRGKCSFKLLQYMAVGLPVVASPYGMNTEILTASTIGFSATSLDEWEQALSTYFEQPALRTAHGSAGRLLVQTSFDTSVVAGRIATLLRPML